MTNDEKLVISKREAACKEAVNSLINLVNAITEERNYYHNRCSEILENKMSPEYRQAINNVLQLINNVEDGDLNFLIRKLEYMLENNKKYSNN